VRVSLLGELSITGIATLRAQNSFARMPYWLSLLADLLARNGQPDAARASLDAALSVGRVHGDVWWLPEVMRMRAAYDDEPDARTRLRSAAGLAAGHGSIALLRRCEDELSRRGANGARTQPSLSSGLYQPALYWPSRTRGARHDRISHRNRLRRAGRRHPRRPDPAG
jgi:hypothetical protein